MVIKNATPIISENFFKAIRLGKFKTEFQRNASLDIFRVNPVIKLFVHFEFRVCHCLLGLSGVFNYPEVAGTVSSSFEPCVNNFAGGKFQYPYY